MQSATSNVQLDSTSRAPAEIRQTKSIAIALKLVERPLWQLVVGLSSGALVLTLLAIEALTLSGWALQTLGRTVVMLTAGGTTLLIFVAAPTAIAWTAQHSVKAARARDVSVKSIKLGVAIAAFGGVTIGILVRLWLIPPT